MTHRSTEAAATSKTTLAPWSRGTNREQRRFAELRSFVSRLAREDFESRYPGERFAPVVVLLAAYDEAETIAEVVKAVPAIVDGIETSTLVVVDGGHDGTDRIALESGAFTCVLPTNLGQGSALRLGYELALDRGARYVVTIDADGQNDPAELPAIIRPLLEDVSDMVVASRRLGTDQTTDRVRRLGVLVYSALINRLTGQELTDTSNGYRAFRSDVLADIVPRLQQNQYQTAEVLITAAKRGWRISEVPTVWHPRAAGVSKKGGNLFFGLQYARVIARTWLREH